MERHIAHERLFRVVAKAHVLKVHAPLDFRRQARGHLGGGVGLDLLLVEDVEHALDARQGVL